MCNLTVKIFISNSLSARVSRSLSSASGLFVRNWHSNLQHSPLNCMRVHIYIYDTVLIRDQPACEWRIALCASPELVLEVLVFNRSFCFVSLLIFYTVIEWLIQKLVASAIFSMYILYVCNIFNCIVIHVICSLSK